MYGLTQQPDFTGAQQWMVQPSVAPAPAPAQTFTVPPGVAVDPQQQQRNAMLAALQRSQGGGAPAMNPGATFANALAQGLSGYMTGRQFGGAGGAAGAGGISGISGGFGG